MESNSEKEKVGNSFLDFLALTVRYRKFLFLFVFIISLTVVVLTLLSDKWYKSTVTVFPSTKTDLLGGLSGISSLVKGFSGGSLSALTGDPELNKYVAILKSSKVIDDVIAKYNYREIYEYDEDDFYEKVKEEFESNLDVNIEEEGNISLTFFDKDPQRAASVANYMISLLNKISTEISTSEAKANRKFIERRYNQNLKDIDSLETEMQIFQEKYGIFEVPEQLKQTVKVMSEIYIQKAQKDIEFNIAQKKYGLDHPITINLKIEIDEFQNKIENLSKGTDRLQEDFKLIMPFENAPELGNKYLKIYRNLEIQYKILEFITPLYEQAKVEEVRNTPSVTVLDVAKPAQKKSKPKASLYGLLAMILSLILGYLIIGIIELRNRIITIKDPKYSELVLFFSRNKRNASK